MADSPSGSSSPDLVIMPPLNTSNMHWIQFQLVNATKDDALYTKLGKKKLNGRRIDRTKSMTTRYRAHGIQTIAPRMLVRRSPPDMFEVVE
jgi:hypothetical protein